MKSSYLLPTATALIGFSIAWLAKPAATPASIQTPIAGEKGQSVTQRPPRSGTDAHQGSKQPKEVKAGDFPLADQADEGPKTRDEARMLRLTEALGLSIDQQGELIKLIESVQTGIDGTAPAIEDLTKRGKTVQEGLAKLLTPEQLAKFEELRIRERENRVEARSQKMLTAAIEEIDLSPEQREEVLNRLRQKAKAELESIPAAATLLFDKSILPTNGKELSSDGILMLAKMNEELPVGEPMVVHQKLLDRQRAELEELLRCFDGVLTAGQMGQYQAGLAESRKIMESLPARAIRQKEEPKEEPKEPEEASEPVIQDKPEILPNGYQGETIISEDSGMDEATDEATDAGENE